jgi:hypothetical protein
MHGPTNMQFKMIISRQWKPLFQVYRILQKTENAMVKITHYVIHQWSTDMNVVKTHKCTNSKWNVLSVYYNLYNRHWRQDTHINWQIQHTMQSLFFADLINSKQVLKLSSLLFVAVIWQTATIFFLTDEDVIILPDPKNSSNGFFFCDECSQCTVNVLGFNKQILLKIWNQFENKRKEVINLQW